MQAREGCLLRRTSVLFFGKGWFEYARQYAGGTGENTVRLRHLRRHIAGGAAHERPAGH